MLPHAYDVAVVIPMFNAANTITETVESVIAQTNFSAIQLILVNNNSTDDTLSLAQTLAERHPNIEVVDHPTGKCGGARNAGVARVRASYVTFLDSDDLLPPDSIEHRLQTAQRDDSDVVLCAVEIFPPRRIYTPPHLYSADRVIEGLDAEPGIAWVALATHMLVRSEFFDDPRNRFPEDTHFEDVPVTTAALSQARRISVTSRVGYLYRREEHLTTIMTNAYTTPANYLAHLRICASVAERHREHPTHHVILGRMLMRFMSSYVDRARSVLSSAELSTFFAEAHQFYRQYPLDVVAERCTTPTRAIALYALVAGEPDVFCDPQSHLAGVVEAPQGGEADSPASMIKLDRPHIKPAEQLLAVRHSFKWSPESASITHAHADGDDVTIRWELKMPPAPDMPAPLTTCGLRLELGPDVPTFDAAAYPTSDPQVWTLTTIVDASTLPPGKYRMRLSSHLRPGRAIRIDDLEPLRPGKGLKIRRSNQGSSIFLVVSKSRLATAPA